MVQITPVQFYDNTPCTMVACGCALDYFRHVPGGQSRFDVSQAILGLKYHNDGYLSLQGTNKLVRQLLHVSKGGYKYFKRNERSRLRDYDFEGKSAIVMVLGHCIFVSGNDYYSFFENEDDDIVAIWFVEGER